MLNISICFEKKLAMWLPTVNHSDVNMGWPDRSAQRLTSPDWRQPFL